MKPLVVAVLAGAMLPGVVLAQQRHGHPPEHAQLHKDFYSKLARPDVPAGAAWAQKSCCSNRDCRPVQARFSSGAWEFLGADGWRRVPPRKLLDVQSPDTRAHACVSPGTREILCFVKPGFAF